jgi:type II secretion system protein C
MSLNRVAVWTANAALAVLCCWMLAGVAGSLAGGVLAPAVPAEAAPIPTPAATERGWKERQVILDRNLFNSALLGGETEEAVDLAKTKLPLKLLGTAAGADEKSSWAAVEDMEKRQHLVVRVADRLQGKAEVIRIERRRIVLRNGGTLEELALDEDTKGAGGRTAGSRSRSMARRPMAAAQPPPTPPPDETSGNSPVERVQRLAGDRFGVSRGDVESIANNPAALFSQARILPKYEEGQMVGVQLNSIQQGSLFEQIGIQNGDIITEFNGIHITNQQDSAAVLRQLTEASEFNVTVQGADGQPRRLTYELRP